MQSIKISAPAKINICLKVLRKREDGYHDLLMLNERLQLSDELEITVDPSARDGSISVKCDDPLLSCDDSNLCVRAAKVMMEVAERRDAIKIDLAKKIPIAAGLGGGSSDAAAVLKGLNELWGLKLSPQKLAKIGLKLGADVPFFCYERPAIVEGIGEKVTTLESLPNIWIILVNPQIPVSTKEVYQRMDLRLTATSDHVTLPRFYKELSEVIKSVHNDLELVTASMCPVIKEIELRLIEYGAAASWMTGSGPTVVGLFSSGAQRNKAFEKLSGCGWKVMSTKNF